MVYRVGITLLTPRCSLTFRVSKAALEPQVRLGPQVLW